VARVFKRIQGQAGVVLPARSEMPEMTLKTDLRQSPKPTREQRLEALALAVRDATRLKTRFDHARAMAHSQARAADRARRIGLEEARKLAGAGFEQWLHKHNL
jgi:hypothetical protein